MLATSTSWRTFFRGLSWNWINYTFSISLYSRLEDGENGRELRMFWESITFPGESSTLFSICFALRINFCINNKYIGQQSGNKGNYSFLSPGWLFPWEDIFLFVRPLRLTSWPCIVLPSGETGRDHFPSPEELFQLGGSDPAARRWSPGQRGSSPRCRHLHTLKHFSQLSLFTQFSRRWPNYPNIADC